MPGFWLAFCPAFGLHGGYCNYENFTVPLIGDPAGFKNSKGERSTGANDAGIENRQN
jgi:hypothetical protein